MPPAAAASSASRTTYQVHGYRLVVPTRLALPAPRTVGRPAGADLRPEDTSDVMDAPDALYTLDVELEPPRVVPAQVPPGELLACLADGDRPLYSVARTERSLVLRFHGYAEVVADPLLRNASAFVHPGVDESVLAVLLPGTVMAVRLLLDAHLVLHASAVERDGGAVAFAGPSGSGKSTLAALGVLGGLRLVTDDVLRVDLDGAGEVRCWPGASAVRLRPDVAHLADHAGPTVPQPRRTADGRLALPAAEVAPGPTPLRHIVLPRLSPDGAEVATPTLRRLDPVTAAQRLLLAPRVLGWTHPEALRRQFERTVDLCERVPVVELGVPVARRGDPEVVRESLDLLLRQ